MIFDDNGRILELQAVGRDITERKLAEEALHRNEERYELAVNAGKVGVWDWDIRTGAIYLDPFLKALLGYEDAEIPNQLEAWVGHVHPEDRDRVVQVAQVCLEGGLPRYEIEHRMVHKNGGIRWFLARGTVFRDADGQPYRMVGTDTDITERKQAEAALQKAQAELAHAARVMTMGELAASLAHELRQPLTAILSNAQAALRFLTGPSPDVDEVREILVDIVADDRRAGEVIDRMYRLLRRGEPERLPLDLNEVIREVVRLMHSEVVIKSVTVLLDLGANLPLVPGDRVQLQQVILNLFINGVEAMSAVEDRSREILIRSCRHGSGSVLVAVQDVGIGLAPQQVERIFDSFYTTKPNGLGLGLPISRSIIEAHGGQLWAEPNQGHGTTVQFTLPAAVP